MPELTIRNTSYRFYTEEDLKDIAELEKMCINPPWSYKALCDFASCPTSRILVASYNYEVYGYITYSEVVDEVQIANVAVHPEQRRRGIGENLLRTLYANSKQNGISIITLEVRESNEPAIRLYRKCGYKEVGRRKKYYTSPSEDALLMNLNL